MGFDVEPDAVRCVHDGLPCACGWSPVDEAIKAGEVALAEAVATSDFISYREQAEVVIVAAAPLLPHHHPKCAAEIRSLRRQLDDALATLDRVVANESNHYDRYWTPPPERLTDEWLDETEAKMREGLEDAFCDDAAAIMLTLIQEIRRLRDG